MGVNGREVWQGRKTGFLSEDKPDTETKFVFSPARLHSLNVAHQVLGQTNPKNLRMKETQSNGVMPLVWVIVKSTVLKISHLQ